VDRTEVIIMESFRLEWDADYGCDHRRGWTVTVNGVVLSELRRWLWVALWEGWRGWRRFDPEYR